MRGRKRNLRSVLFTDPDVKQPEIKSVPPEESDYRRNDIKLICSYCIKHLKGDENAKRISHGICPLCAEKLKDGLDFIKQGIGLPVIWIEKEPDIPELRKTLDDLHRQYSEIIERISIDVDWCKGRRDHGWQGKKKIVGHRETAEI